MEQSVVNSLDRIERTLKVLQANMDDVLLTNEEKEMLDKSIENEREGKLVSFESVKRNS